MEPGERSVQKTRAEIQVEGRVMATATKAMLKYRRERFLPVRTVRKARGATRSQLAHRHQRYMGKPLALG